jgi:G3E family GTPase
MSSLLELFPSREAGPFGRRLKRARGARLPVTIVTGFLGAGKTTLVQQFLATPEGAGTAVVINEFGAVGIDDALVRQSTDEIALIGNGCLCCNTRSDLQLALRRLVAERDQGALPPFRRILIETSGLADPGPILQTFATDRALGAEFFVEVVVTVVDAVGGLAGIGWSAEARKQVLMADRLVISKTDLVAAETVDELMPKLAALNPRAPIVIAKAGVVDPGCLVGGDTEADRTPPTGLIAEAIEPGHRDGIASFVITETEAADWGSFERAMETLIALRGADLLRVKGLMKVVGCRGPIVVQIVQHLAHPPVELESWPPGEHATRLVFITRNLPEPQIRDLLAAVRALAEPITPARRD